MNDYLTRSKRLANGFIFILPLLVMYEVGIVMYGSQVKNSADVMVKMPFAFFGRSGSLIFNMLVVVIFFVAVFRLEKEHRLKFGIYIPMLLESFVYAIFLGPVVGRAVGYVMQRFLADPMTSSGTGMQIVLSVGAGVYEEIVFRLILLTVLNLLFCKVLRLNKTMGIVLSIIVGSVLFSSIHYVGSLSDTFTSSSFIFRFLAGAVLATIFMLRGLGIAVYTHAIYDVMLVINFVGR
ncbi:MAG: CPBP family intramembrane glutamic endopeptidase [Candidatus Anammoxibacter sp.]